MKLLREMIALAGLAYMVIVISATLPILPGRIPVHFDAGGMPNSFGPPEEIWNLPIVAAFLYILFTLINYMVGMTTSTRDRPVPTGRIQSLMGWLKAEMVWTIAYLVWGTLETALGHATGLNPTVAIAPVFVFMATIIGHVMAGSR